MDRGIFVALSGAVVQERRLEVLSNNAANVNTAGYKEEKPVFADMMPSPEGLRTFGVTDKIFTNQAQGHLEGTGRPFDVALTGGGFFALQTPSGVRYTRGGSFIVASDGALSTRDGNKVLGENGPITITGNSVTIDSGGVVKSGGAELGKLKIVSFNNPENLTREGSYYAPTQAQEALSPATTQVEQGFVEGSNVSIIRTMTTMIEASRSYETQAKMIQAFDDMTKKAISDVGSV